jgi:hypothetical protein
MGTAVFLGVKRPGRSVDPAPPFSTEVKERVVGLHGLFWGEGYLHTHIGLSEPNLKKTQEVLPQSAVRVQVGVLLLTPWSRVLLKKLTDFQLVKKFTAFYGTRRYITAFTSARDLSLTSAKVSVQVRGILNI